MKVGFVIFWMISQYDKVKGYETPEGQVLLSKHEQDAAILQKYQECQYRIKNDPYPETGAFCNRTWDGLMCWPETPIGTEARQRCPNYFHGFYTTGTSTKQCLENGQWYFSPVYNTSWTNYSDCVRPYRPHPTQISSTFTLHIARIQLMYNMGYGLSLISLLLAVFILLYFRKLRCPRNTVHINMFLSFILRAIICFLRDHLLVEGLGLAIDVERTPENAVLFIESGSHWECKLIYTLFHYLLSANYMWILVEGLYLHTLVNVSVFSERSSVRWYLLLGWGAPALSVIPWVIVRATLEDILCWNTNPTNGFFWILKTPIVVSLLVNFFFFINILRALFTKVHLPNASAARRSRYRRLAKATLILIPLFGVHFIVFIFVPDNVDPTADLVKLYFEMFFNSFQGFFVAVLFCFLNQEVQMEIRKKWHRLWSKTDPRYIQQSQYLAASINNGRRKQGNSCRQSVPNRGSLVMSSDSSSDQYGCLCKWTVDKNGKLRRSFVNKDSLTRKKSALSVQESKL